MTAKLMLFFITVLLGCSSIAHADSHKKTVEKLNGYFVKNTVQFDDNFDFKHLVITNKKDFDKHFGAAKTMKNKVDTVNFKERSVIAIVTKPSQITKKTDLVYYEFDGDNLLIRYHIREGDKNTYQSMSLYLGTIPKGITRVSFKSRYNVGIVDIKQK